MRHLANRSVYWAVLLLGTLILAPSASAAPLQVKSLRSEVSKAVAGWERARTARVKVRDEAQVLAHRIAALKRLEKSRPLMQKAELNRLLSQSITTEKAMKQRTKEVRRNVDLVRAAVLRAARSIDAEIRYLVPALRSGSKSQRKAAARRINELRQFRKELQRIRLHDRSVTPKAWASFAVEIEALDGPNELKEKADFLEDHRDKVRRKHRALLALLAQRKQEHEILSAKKRFDTDIDLFQDNDPSERVSRTDRGSSGVTTYTSNNENENAKSETAYAPPSATNNRESPAPGPVGGGHESDPGVSGTPQDALTGFAGTVDSDADLASDDGAREPTESVRATTSTPRYKQGTVAKQVNPGVLLGMRVEDLAENTDVETLKRLINEMDRLSQWLGKRSSSFRNRAEQLEEDENRAFGQ